MNEFMFVTGIECSYPTIRHGVWRVDELDETGHYKHWHEDLYLTREMGIRFLRYGFSYHLINSRPYHYDWSFTDEVLTEMRRLEIEPIIDLCHFGMPDWLGNSFQNPDFPDARDNPHSPIAGMPILEVDRARSVVVLKRGTGKGFSGLENPLFFKPATGMLYGDARESLARLTQAVQQT